jgi:hypothetical protein
MEVSAHQVAFLGHPQRGSIGELEGDFLGKSSGSEVWKPEVEVFSKSYDRLRCLIGNDSSTHRRALFLT